MMCDAFSDSKRFHAYMLKHRNGEVGAILSFRPSPVHNINQRWNLHKARTSAGTGLLMCYAWSSLKATPTCSMTGQRAAIFILIGQFWPVQVWVYSAHDTLGISRCLEIRWLSQGSKKNTHTHKYTVHYIHPSIHPSLPTYVQYVRTHVCTHLHYITLYIAVQCSKVPYSTLHYTLYMPRTPYAKKKLDLTFLKMWSESVHGYQLPDLQSGTLTECPASLRHFCVLPYSCMTKIPMHAGKYVNLIQLKCNAYVYTRVLKDMHLQFAYSLFQEKTTEITSPVSPIDVQLDFWAVRKHEINARM